MIPSNKKEVYSTEEVRIGTWIDGKPLYRKVFNIGTLPNTGISQSYTTGLNHTDYNFVKIYGFAKSSGATLPLPIYEPRVVENSIGLNIDGNGNITIATNKDRSAYTGTVILEYTKTTDIGEV